MSAALSQAGLPAAPAPQVELIALRVGADEYVIDILRVREVIRPQPIVPLRRGPAHIEGVISLRRSVVPVVDLGRRLGLHPSAGPSRRIIVAMIDGRAAGLAVDAVTEVVRLPATALRPGPVGLTRAAPFFLGLCSHRGRLLTMLDVRHVVGAIDRADVADAMRAADVVDTGRAEVAAAGRAPAALGPGGPR